MGRQGFILYFVSDTWVVPVLYLGPATEGTFYENTACSVGPQTVGTPSERYFASGMKDGPSALF